MTDRDALEQEFQETIHALVRPAVMQVAQDVDRSVQDVRLAVKEYRNTTSRHVDELADEVRALKSRLEDVRAGHEVDLEKAQSLLSARVSAADEQMRAAVQQAANQARQDHLATLAALDRANALLQDATGSAERLHVRWSEGADALNLRLARLQEAVELTDGPLRELGATASDVAARNETRLRLLEEAVRELPQVPLLVDQHALLQRDVASLRAVVVEAATACQRTGRVATWLLVLLVLLCVASVASGVALLSR